MEELLERIPEIRIESARLEQEELDFIRAVVEGEQNQNHTGPKI
jgi:hypothetical protein